MRPLFNCKAEQIVKLVKSNRKVYVLARCLKERNSPEFYNMLLSYYEGKGDPVAVFTERHPGALRPDEIVYKLHFREDKKYFGFFAMMRLQLGCLAFAEHLGFTPSVFWGPETAYHDPGMDEKIKNVYEYYFETIPGVPPEEVELCRNVVDSTLRQPHFVQFPLSYRPTEEDMVILGAAYRKYIRLNSETKEYLQGQLATVLNKRTLGVHARGTDFNLNQGNHPIPVSPQDYVMKARELFSEGRYDQIFLATEDQNTLELFVRSFGDNVVYYNDTARSRTTKSPHALDGERPLHRFLLGRECLRDVYTLACCDSLITGLSQVSFAARYINHALDRSFERSVVMDNGVNTFFSQSKKRRQR